MSRLKEKYDAEIKSAMVEKFGYKNVMQIPKLDKIVINMGVGEERTLRFSTLLSRILRQSQVRRQL